MSSDSSSEFELSLDADSGSFELQLNSDSSEEVPLGAPQTAGGSRPGGQSGINLGKPADSGVSLERGGDAAAGGLEADSDDFELSLDPSDAGPKSSGKLRAPKSGKKTPAPKSDSDSEFELTLDDNSGVTDNLAAELETGRRQQGRHLRDRLRVAGCTGRCRFGVRGRGG